MKTTLNGPRDVTARSRHANWTKLRVSSAAALLLLVLAGCAAGPDYKAPHTEVPSAFANGTQTNLNTGETLVTWWRSFNDPRLDALVDRALTNNLDLRIATANLREARALHRFTQFDLAPVVSTDASYRNSLSSTAAAPGVNRPGREGELYDAGFDAVWELDLFGHVRRTVQATAAEVQVAEANRRDVQVSLISEVARNYFELRGAQNQLAVARRNADNQNENLKITLAMFEGGRGTELDTSRARAQWNATLSTIPPLETAVARAIHRLSVLTGQQPTALVAELKVPAPLPDLPALVSIGDPETLLRRRPDVRAAERGLAAATARIGIATSELFPRVTFNGRIGLEASQFAGLGRSGADTWSFGPSITWAALDLGHVRARINAADARTEAALANYERTVLTTLEETENALVAFGQEQTRRDFLQEAERAGEIAATLARQRYENGISDFLSVLDAERALFLAQDQLAQSQTRTGTSLVAIYKALGGGWETPAAVR